MEFRDLLSLAWKRRWTVLGVFALAIVLSAVFASMLPERYESTATIALTPDVRRGQGFVASDNLSALLGTYAATAESTLNLRRAEARLGRPLPGDIETSTEAGTGILRITAEADSPQDAVASAAATAEALEAAIRGNRLLISTLVGPPAPPTEPVQPRPPLVIFVAGVLGLFAGIVLAYALEHLRRRVATPADVAALTPAPVVGRLPRQRVLARGSAQLVWDRDNVVALQESYRGMRTNLQFILQSTSQVLEVTSPEAEQGKSTVVANLAVALGQIGVETVIVDADLRRPRQHEIFGLDNDSGLSTTMALGGEPELKPSGHPNLWVVTSGPVPPDPTEMLSIRFPTVVQALRGMESLVIVDTPPLLPVSDARVMAPHTDGVLLVVGADTQKPASLQSALEQLRLVDATLVGVVLNKTGKDAKDAGGYYYGRPPAADRQLETA
jgi:succinoglycan biosynthesis transport protein ExoP